MTSWRRLTGTSLLGLSEQSTSLHTSALHHQSRRRVLGFSGPIVLTKHCLTYNTARLLVTQRDDDCLEGAKRYVLSIMGASESREHMRSCLRVAEVLACDVPMQRRATATFAYIGHQPGHDRVVRPFITFKPKLDAFCRPIQGVCALYYQGVACRICPLRALMGSQRGPVIRRAPGLLGCTSEAQVSGSFMPQTILGHCGQRL